MVIRTKKTFSLITGSMFVLPAQGVATAVKHIYSTQRVITAALGLQQLALCLSMGGMASASATPDSCKAHQGGGGKERRSGPRQ